MTAIDASVITAASNTDLRASASESASLVASTTNGSSLTEASARVLGISSSPVTAGDNLNAITSATLSLNGQALSTAGSARALSGAGAGAATSTNASAATLADTTSQVIGLRQANQSAGADLNLNASADLELTALARTVDGSRRLDFIQANGDSGQETFFAPNSGLVQGDLVQLSGATPQTADLIPDTNYWVRDLAFGAIGSGNTITMPNGVSYTNGMTVVFRLNDAAAANLVDESVTLSVNGITLGRTYFVTGASGGTFQIAETAGGTAVPLTSSNSLPSGLIDGERFQLSSAADPFAPVVNLADGATANISFSQIATASAFAGGRPSTTNIGSAARLDPSLERAQVLGISGNHSAGHSISSGADATVIAAAAANLDSRAINVASPASAGAAANVTGIDGVMIAAAADGSVRATAAADAQVAATTTGSSANSDFALANTLVDVIGIRSRGAADTTTIAADGTITAAARIGSGTTASTVVGNSDALAILNATAISLANAGASTTIGGVGSISASADLGSLAAPILVSATSAANGIARANLAGDAIGIFGTANGSDYPPPARCSRRRPHRHRRHQRPYQRLRCRRCCRGLPGRRRRPHRPRPAHWYPGHRPRLRCRHQHPHRQHHRCGQPHCHQHRCQRQRRCGNQRHWPVRLQFSYPRLDRLRPVRSHRHCRQSTLLCPGGQRQRCQHRQPGGPGRRH